MRARLHLFPALKGGREINDKTFDSTLRVRSVRTGLLSRLEAAPTDRM